MKGQKIPQKIWYNNGCCMEEPFIFKFFLTFIPINQSNFRGKCVSLQMYDNVRVMFNAVLLCITNEIYALVLKP